MPQRRVYSFGGGRADGRGEMKELLGGKGANLAEMTNLGIPVPAGFTISTKVCTYYMDHVGAFPDGLAEEVEEAIHKVEKEMRRGFGGSESPLLFSVRSGARASMPGMMDTVLNIGLNDETAASIIAKTGKERFVYDSYRRLIQMYADVVMGLDIDEFHALQDTMEIGVGGSRGELLGATGLSLRFDRAGASRRARAEVLAATEDELRAPDRVTSVPLFVRPGARLPVHDRRECALGASRRKRHGHGHAVGRERHQQVPVGHARFDAAHAIAPIDEVDPLPSAKIDDLVRLCAREAVLVVRTAR